MNDQMVWCILKHMLEGLTKSTNVSINIINSWFDFSLWIFVFQYNSYLFTMQISTSYQIIICFVEQQHNRILLKFKVIEIYWRKNICYLCNIF
jgi:hypothetical protein